MVWSRWVPLLVLLTVAAGAAGSTLAQPGLGEAAEGAQETGADLTATALLATEELGETSQEGARTAQEAAEESGEDSSAEAGKARQAAEDAADQAEVTGRALVADSRDRAEQTLGTLQETVLRPAEEQVEALRGDVEKLTVPSEPGSAPDEPQATSSVSQVHVPMPMLIAGATVAAAAAGTFFFWLAGSSGSAGISGAAGARAAGLGNDVRRVLPLASPLFTRFERETVMGHPKREELYALVVGEPGISLQRMCDATGLSRTAVTHHLRLLEHHHVIVSRRVGRSRHYFENGGRYGRDQKEAYAVLQNERSRQVATFIRTHPGAIQKHVCEALGLQASIAHWHVRRLQEAALVETVRQGRTVSYFPTSGLQRIESGA